MNTRVGLVIPIFIILAYLSPVSVKSQRLYDEQRDKQAQDAIKLAEEVINQSTFDKQLKNLEAFVKRDFEVHFKGAKRQMEYDINGFRTWGDINAFVKQIKEKLNQGNFIDDATSALIIADLNSDCNQPKRTDLGKKICDTKKELRAMEEEVEKSKAQGKALEEELKTRLEKIDEVETLIEKARTYFKNDSISKKAQTVQDLTTVFLNMGRSYVNFANKLRSIKNQPLDEVRLILYRVAVETLQVEADHWKTIGEIKLRRAEEQKDLFRLVNDYEFRFAQTAKCLRLDSEMLSEEKVNITLTKAKAIGSCSIVVFDDRSKGETLRNEEIISYIYNGLYSAATLASRGETPYKLAELRLAHEEHRFSIRQSAVIARGYEIVFQSGTKRLGRYYAGGIKPEKIAQLIYSAATVAIPAVIAGK